MKLREKDKKTITWKEFQEIKEKLSLKYRISGEALAIGVRKYLEKKN